MEKNKKIVIIGGSGLIGKKLVKNLRQHGHEVVAASPSSGVNTLTGEGLAEALVGASVVVDVANSPSFEDTYFGTAVNDQSLTPGDQPRLGPTGFEDWLNRSKPQRQGHIADGPRPAASVHHQ